MTEGLPPHLQRRYEQAMRMLGAAITPLDRARARHDLRIICDADDSALSSRPRIGRPCRSTNTGDDMTKSCAVNWAISVMLKLRSPAAGITLEAMNADGARVDDG